MNITQELKIEIYHALADFLTAYKTENTQVLAEKFGISGEFLYNQQNEMSEMAKRNVQKKLTGQR